MKNYSFDERVTLSTKWVHAPAFEIDRTGRTSFVTDFQNTLPSVDAADQVEARRWTRSRHLWRFGGNRFLTHISYIYIYIYIYTYTNNIYIYIYIYIYIKITYIYIQHPCKSIYIYTFNIIIVHMICVCPSIVHDSVCCPQENICVRVYI